MTSSDNTIFFVSVIVPVYNGSDSIRACIESLLELNYPKDRLEILIVDNNSKDNTAEIIKQYPVTYLLEDKIQTSYAARNNAISKAKGDILAFTDSDCIIDKNWLIEGIKSFSDPHTAGIGGKIITYEPQSHIEKYQDRIGTFDRDGSISTQRLKEKTAKIITANAFYRKSIFNELGAFDASLPNGGDAEMSYRIQHKSSYTLSYNEKAIVLHKHRTSLKSFWKQFAGYGYGNLLVWKRYNAQQKHELSKYGSLKPLYWKIRFGILRNIWKLIKASFIYLFTFSLENKTKVIDAFLFTIQQTAFFRGELRCCRKHKIPLYCLFRKVQ